MKNFIRRLLAVVAVLVHAPVFAEDIDLFVGATANSTDVPNVLIILDNTANWNTAFTNEKAALVSVFNGLTVDKFNVGLMMFTETGGGDSGNDGAYVRAAIRLMNSANKTKYADMINSLDVIADKSNSGKAGKAMEEAYLYLSAGTPHAGNNKNKTDYTGNTSGTTQSNAVYAISGNALSLKSATRYNNPVLAGCSKNYIIYISNGKPSDSASDTSQATDALSTAGGSTTTIPLNPSGSQDNIADEWARFMKVSSLGVTVYTIDINKNTTGQGPGWTALLKSMASQSSGKYFDVASSGTGSEISDALNNIFSEIQSVNSVFASVSLPVSGNMQGTFLNQVFVGMFRPDQDANPRWPGNLKQYKIGKVGTDVQLQDAGGVNALNSQTGFVTECARSYWTPSTVDTEWSARPSGDCLTVANSRISNYPDGNVVEKGGQAYKLRSTTTRTMKTCSAAMASCTTLTDFNTGNDAISASLLGASSAAERESLINWARGRDTGKGGTEDEDLDGATTDDMRLSAHGDVLHSRPVAINFGTASSPQVVVFYGGNDGALRAVNGNQTAAIGSIPAGGELWSFMPPEFYSKIRRLSYNTPPVSYPNGPSGQPKPYGIDGPITSFKGTISGTSKDFIYATMRRGGRVLYAFDVTNSLAAPSSPTLKWKIGCPNAENDTDCTSGMSGVGQTWSAPQILYATGYGAGALPLLVMGGGYDTCEDYDALSATGANHNCTTSSKGNKVYVLDADTGAVVKVFSTDRSVISSQVIATDSAGKATYGWTADLGGNVYRMNFSGASAADWTITKIASLGCDTVASCTANRKFISTPSVVPSGNDYVILLGSGEREKPLTYYASTSAVTNYFFVFTDKPTVAAATYPGSGDCGSNIICKASLLGITGSATPTAAALAAKKGWYLGLAVATEQVVTAALTVDGVVNFSTHQPAVPPVAGSCSSNLGTIRVYNMNYKNAAPANGTDDRYQISVSTGLPPDPVAGRVDGIGPVRIGGGACGILCPELLSGGAAGSPPKGRLYWYIQK